MKFPGLTKVLTAATLAVGSLTVNISISQAGSPPPLGGFWCDHSGTLPGHSGTLPQTKLRKLDERGIWVDALWISWKSTYFNKSGYTPGVRCEIVTRNLNRFLNNQQLNLISVGRNGDNRVLCVAVAPGNCISGDSDGDGEDDGQIYTLKPNQDAVRTLQEFLALLSNSAAPSLIESPDGYPYVNVTQLLEGSTGVSNNPSVPPANPVARPDPNPGSAPCLPGLCGVPR